jgi:hypothetical protein
MELRHSQQDSAKALGYFQAKRESNLPVIAMDVDVSPNHPPVGNVNAKMAKSR